MLVGLGLAGCQASSGDQPFVLARPVALDADQPRRAKVGRLRYEAGFVLTSDDERFGGISGLWISPEGDELIMVSDHGTIWRTNPEHLEDQLYRFGDFSVAEIQLSPGDGERVDAEALARDASGRLIVAVEGRNPLRRLPPDGSGGVTQPVAGTQALEQVAVEAGNTGIEALASLPEGGLLAITEGVYDGPDELVAWWLEGDRLQPVRYAVSDGFEPTGADWVDETIYVVERKFSVADAGFSSRIVALDGAQMDGDNAISGELLAELAWPVIHDNFEGIAVRKASDGRVLIYLVSDDNFLPLQRTLLLQFSLEP